MCNLMRIFHLAVLMTFLTGSLGCGLAKNWIGGGSETLDSTDDFAVLNVSSTDSDGTYGVGSTIHIDVTFDKSIVVDTTGGTPLLSLGVGASRTAVYASGSGSATLTFTYVVQPGDSASVLDYTSAAALVLSGSTITSESGRTGSVTLPTAGGPNSIGGQKTITIDTTAPAVPNALTLVTPSTSPNILASPTIRVGGVVSGDIVTLYSDAMCSAQVGDGTASGTTIDITTGALSAGVHDFYANSRDTLGNISDCSTATVAYELDLSGPAVLSVTSSKTNGAYKAGEVIAIAVTFDDTVVVTGTPQLNLATGGGGQLVNYSSGSTTSTLIFNYTVMAGDNSADLDYLAVGSLLLNSGTIQDTLGNDADLDLPAPGGAQSLGGQKALVIDTTAPTAPSALSLVTPASSPSDVRTPTIGISGVVSGDTVELYTNSICTTQVGSAVSSGTSVNIASSSLVDGTYNFYAKSTDPLGNASVCSSATVSYLLEREFTWISGGAVPARATRLESFGTKGVAAASNSPGARNQAMTWVDSSGNLWLFGGNISSLGTMSGQHNDLWKYDVTTHMWTWISGSHLASDTGSYGSLGVASASNLPPSRGTGAAYTMGGMYMANGGGSATWVDASGNLWLFGGYSIDVTYTYHFLGDLWKFNPSTSQWTWMGGSSSADTSGVYGTKGTPSVSNIPGARSVTSCWVDGNGDFWLFGGQGKDSAGTTGVMNDLWRLNPTTLEWTWMTGSNTVSGAATYGTLGVGSTSNTPGYRSASASAVDSSGNLWLFGGVTTASYPFAYHNDLWRYTPSDGKWTWMKGADTGMATATYGTLGTAAGANTPGGRAGGAFVADASGNLWLFGGNGLSASASSGNLSDVWKYNVTSGNWTWVSGVSTSNSIGTVGSLGVPSTTFTPGSRVDFSVWFSGGKLWIHGGMTAQYVQYGCCSSSQGSNKGLADLWNLNISNLEWTWSSGGQPIFGEPTFGTLGVESPTNGPGVRSGSSMWSDSSGNIWFFGGSSNDANMLLGQGSNDLWRFNTSNSQWKWVSGSNVVNQYGTYGVKGTPSVSNIPGARMYSLSWKDSNGNFWLFGGWGLDASGTLGNLNDLWKYNPTTSEWTWVAGANSVGQGGTYGTMGTGSVSNIPGARYWSANWTDASGNFWLFGGFGYDGASSSGSLNDVWKFNPTNLEWTWVAGSSAKNASSTYGTKGTASISNIPGARYQPTAVVDGSGNILIFGGLGKDSAGTNGTLSDLWKFNPTTLAWTWVSGSDIVGVTPTYGTQGVANAGNVIGAHRGHVMWIDSAGDIFIYGGYGLDSAGGDGQLNDLWKYNPTLGQWTWLKGSGLVYSSSVNGSMGVSAATNIPGGLAFASFIQDVSGAVWIFGGGGFGPNGEVGTLGTLWVYR